MASPVVALRTCVASVVMKQQWAISKLGGLHLCIAHCVDEAMGNSVACVVVVVPEEIEIILWEHAPEKVTGLI
jgi:hypothetical protein